MGMDENDAGSAGSAQEGKKSNKMLLIIIVLLLVIGGAGGAVLFMSGEAKSSDDAEEEFEEEHSFEYKQLELDHFVVNLGAGSRYLRIRLLLEYDEGVFNAAERSYQRMSARSGKSASKEEEGEGAPKLPGVFGRRNPMIRDAVITLLSSKRASELLSLDGKEALKKELLDKINAAIDLEDSIVTNVYFGEFIIQ